MDNHSVIKVIKRVRHCDELYKIPGNDEIDAALYLYNTHSKPELLIQGYQILKVTEFINKINNNYKEYSYIYAVGIYRQILSKIRKILRMIFKNGLLEEKKLFLLLFLKKVKRISLVQRLMVISIVYCS